ALSTGYIEQVDADVQNYFAGELKVGDDTDYTTLSKGSIFTTGNVYDANSPEYMLDLDGISRIEDLAVGSVGEALLSERLPNYVLKGVLLSQYNDLVPMPDCGTRGYERIVVTPFQWSTYFLNAGNITMNNNINKYPVTREGTNWRVKMRTYNPANKQEMDDTNGYGLSHIYCYYPET
ncbi:hypothetical protein P4S58_23700, partial [Vibrio sp. Hal054]